MIDRDSIRCRAGSASGGSTRRGREARLAAQQRRHRKHASVPPEIRSGDGLEYAVQKAGPEDLRIDPASVTVPSRISAPISKIDQRARRAQGHAFPATVLATDLLSYCSQHCCSPAVPAT